MRSLMLFPLALLLSSCGGSSAQLPHERREARKALQHRLAAFENTGLVIGTFPLSNHKPIIDGDTIRVAGLDTTLRLLGIDTEETFKHETERRAYEAGWEQYLKNMRGNSKRPVKMATPMGMEAKEFAEKFFAGVDTVELERDDPKEIRGYYNRYLAYVFIVKNGKRLNYNVEAVRAGESPYFTKYGYSRRFNDQFVEAEKEARAAHRGIWDPTKRHYPDYAERKAWWDARADFIKKFEEDARGKDNYIQLTHYDAPQRLEENLGKEVVVLGSVSNIRLGQGNAPTLVMLSRRRGNDFPLVFFDRDVFLTTGLEHAVGDFVRVRGYVNRYDDPHRKRFTLQIKIDVPSQITIDEKESVHAAH